MARNQPSDPAIDVMVLGCHPSAYLAAALMRHKGKLRVVHATIPGEDLADRLVLVNPALFSLHPLLENLRRKIDLAGVYGLRFLSDDPAVASEYRSRSAVACVGMLKDVRDAVRAVAEGEDVELMTPRALQVQRVDEQGVEVQVGNQLLKPKALIVAGRLPREQERVLAIPEEWERGILRRYAYVRLRGTKMSTLGAKPLVPMSLDLGGKLMCAWMLPGEKHTQLAVEQPLDNGGGGAGAGGTARSHELLRHWAEVLTRHGALRAGTQWGPDEVQRVDLPLAGALAHEGVASRTLLIGPAGGFYSASGEDVYPNCWSAVYAVDVLRKALKERHLQDAIQAYRQKWRTTLGDYLRGPQMDLRFLLTLVYRNQEMTNRLAEAILLGRSIVR